MARTSFEGPGFDSPAGDQTISTRKRMVGGFYAYDNRTEVKEIGNLCNGSTDERGLLLCEAELQTPGEVQLIVRGTDAQGHKTLVVKMKYVDGAPAITGITRVSTPGRRLYSTYTDIPRVLNGLGIAIVSTSKGLMKDADCRRNKAGGELICNVW